MYCLPTPIRGLEACWLEQGFSKFTALLSRAPLSVLPDLRIEELAPSLLTIWSIYVQILIQFYLKDLHFWNVPFWFKYSILPFQFLIIKFLSLHSPCNPFTLFSKPSTSFWLCFPSYLTSVSDVSSKEKGPRPQDLTSWSQKNSRIGVQHMIAFLTTPSAFLFWFSF